MNNARGIHFISVEHPGFPTASRENIRPPEGFPKWSTAAVLAKNHMLDSFVVSKSN